MSKTKFSFGIVSKNIMTDPELSLQAKGLYAILCTYANKQRQCYPSLNTLSDISNKSVSQVSAYIRELKNKGYLTRIGKVIILR
jgi:Fic family protein